HFGADPLRGGTGCRDNRDECRRLSALECVGDGGEDFSIHLLELYEGAPAAEAASARLERSRAGVGPRRAVINAGPEGREGRKGGRAVPAAAERRVPPSRCKAESPRAVKKRCLA